MRAAYFVHDLTDPAVHRRARMLTAAGASLTVLGFRRTGRTPEDVSGAPVIDLGRTHDARLAHRVLSAGGWIARARALAPMITGADAIIARNLEMLAIAAAVRRAAGSSAPLVYECLDIHRLMLAAGAKGAALRWLERRLLGASDALIFSSPAFLEAYFAPRQGVGQTARPEPLLIENKVLTLDAPPPVHAQRPSGRPWRIGWFGMIRCRRSVEVLSALAARRPGEIEVVIRGRPSPAVFPDFEAEVAGRPGLIWGGPYQPSDLPELYRGVHFTWTPDWYEDGLNSNWLLPNRLYEGGLSGTVPIARRGVETGRWLEARGLGVLFDDPVAELAAFFDGLDEAGYRRLEAASAAADPSLFAADRAECARLVDTLERLAA